MPAITVTIDVILVLVGLILVWWLWAAMRWRNLCRTAGSFPCTLIDADSAKRSQRHGVARFGDASLRWYARGSLSYRPVHHWPRATLEVMGCPKEEIGTGGPWETVRLTSGGRSFVMVLSRSASAGLIGWLEAGPSHQNPVIR